MEAGRIVHSKVSLREIVDYSRRRLAQLPAEHKRLDNPHVYKVGLSDPLKKLRDKMLHEAAEK
jgi:nicotinate phosphoribosyltransferase